MKLAPLLFLVALPAVAETTEDWDYSLQEAIFMQNDCIVEGLPQMQTEAAIFELRRACQAMWPWPPAIGDVPLHQRGDIDPATGMPYNDPLGIRGSLPDKR